MQKNGFTVFSVKVTARVYIVQIELFLLNLPVVRLQLHLV